MILLDTSALIDCFCGHRASLSRLTFLLESGEALGLGTLTLYEWRRGQRKPEELRDQQRLLPDASAIVFGPQEAALSAELYRTLTRSRSRQMDIAIAACALRLHASLWTLNRRDFGDIPGLRLV